MKTPSLTRLHWLSYPFLTHVAVNGASILKSLYTTVHVTILPLKETIVRLLSFYFAATFRYRLCKAYLLY